MVTTPFFARPARRWKTSASCAALADAIAVCDEDATVSDILRFDQPMAAANDEGGTRDPVLIYPRLKVIDRVYKTRPYVIVDDVLTSGGHIAAGITILREQGADVDLVVCGVSAEKFPVDDPFAKVDRTIPDFDPSLGYWVG